MNHQANTDPHASGGFNVRDILFVIFKHKWKIAFLAALGIGAAAAVFVMQRPLYASQAKLMVRYVVERSAVDLYEEERRGGGHILNAEMEILRSADLALEVAERVGPGKIVPPDAEPTLQGAAARIRSGLQVFPAKDSNVINVIYQDENPEMAAVVLAALVQSYFEKHLEIHRALGASDYVMKQRDQAQARLRETEQELEQLKSQYGIVSLASSTEALEAQRSRIRDALMAAEAELVEQRARLAALGGRSGEMETEGEEDAVPVADAEVAGPDAESFQRTREELVLAMAEHRDLANRLNFLRQRRNELLSRYTASNPLVASTQRQILEAEAQRRQLIARHPALIAESAEGTGGTAGPDLAVENARLEAVQARAEALKDQEARVQKQLDDLSGVGSRIVGLERRRALEEEKFRYLQTSLERARADASLDPAKMPNITTIEKPTAPARAFDAEAMKLVYGLAAGGLALGLGLAFLLEMVIDPRVKRPAEIQTRLQLPLIMTIPHMRARKRDRMLPLESPAVPRIGTAGDGTEIPALPAPPNGGRDHFMKTYAEALRDRIIFNFGVNNVTHKPKIIGLTGLSEGAGTSTIAAGIAKAFAEAPGMKVLFVDLNSHLPEGNPVFGKNRPLSLPGALESARDPGFREDGENLLYASAAAGPRGIVPLQVHEMMPYIRFSDFDYIVFDMPPLDQTSPTLSMAGLMDKVLLVLDADNTSRDTLQWGYSELTRGRADVSCVFNKAKAHAPKWVLGEV